MDAFDETNEFEEPKPQEPEEEVTEPVSDWQQEETPSQEQTPEPDIDSPQQSQDEWGEEQKKASPFSDSPYYSAWQPQSTGGDAGSDHQSQSTSAAAEHTTGEKKSKKKNWKPAAAVAAAVILVAGCCGITAAAVNSHWETKTDELESELNARIDALEGQTGTSSGTSSSVSSIIPATSEGLTPSEVYSMNVSAVVAISNQSVTTNIYGQTSETASSGSGFIISEDGYVVTNYHVVEDATTLTVITYDSTEYVATLIGYDSSNDVALLKVDATGLPYVTIGSSDELCVGDQVVAIGNPLGELTSSLSVGYVSAKDRTINTDGTYINMIQIDAAINSGNSGGPLFNMKGEVVGITTAKYSGSTSSGATIEGIGFAIPMDDVVGIVSDLMEYGYVTGAYLGVSVTTVTDELLPRYGIPQGSYVESVVDGYCAQIAGVQQKDIIVALGEYEVTSNTDLTQALRKFDPGDTTTITVYRSGQYLELTITLDEKPVTTETDDDTTSDSDSSEMPSDGSYEEWYEYFAPYFSGGGR